MFEYFSSGFDFEGVLTEAFYMEDGNKYFKLPSKNTDAISLVYLLLKEINYKRIQLADILDFFDAGKNYEISYKNFSREVLMPFMTYTYEIGMQMINSTGGFNSKSPVNERENTSIEEELVTSEESIKSLDKSHDFATLKRLLDLDKLSITQSRVNDETKEELKYVLNIFESEVRNEDEEKIKLSYLAYYYAMRPYKRIKNNLKSITEILIKINIL